MCAIAGHFPHLPPTPGPLGIELNVAGHRRCLVCRLLKPLAQYTYGGGHTNSCATCQECRDVGKTGVNAWRR